MIALQLFMEIVNSDIILVTLSDNQVYTAATVDMQQLIISIVVMSRAHEESATKSQRLSAAWQNKRNNAGDGKKLTARCPSWLRLSADRRSFAVIPDRAAIVRRIFDEAVAALVHIRSLANQR